MDIQTINIPELIKSNQYYQLTSSIKNFEDTLQKLLINGKMSSISNNNYGFIWEIDSQLFPDFKDNLKEIGTEIFGDDFNKLGENIVITGPFVRSCLVNTSEYSNKVIKELYFYKCSDENWSEIIDTSLFLDKKTEYVFQDENKKIFLVKKKYRHPSHIILQHDYLKRVGFCNGTFYASSMFLIEMQKHFTLLNSKFKDPILNIPYDPLGIYKTKEKDNLHPVKIIEMVNLDELIKLSKKSLNKLYTVNPKSSPKTCMELCLDKFINEDHPVLLGQLVQMIVYLGGQTTQIKRPPYLYARMIDIHNKSKEVYIYLKSLKGYYDIEENVIENQNIKTIDDINNCILEYLIINDNFEEFNEYLSFSKQKINKLMINSIIKNESNQIEKNIIEKKILDKHLIYYLILMSENFELIKLIDFEIDLDVCINYLKDILENGKVRSFFYLYDRDQNILGTIFDDNKNICHLLKQNGNYLDLTELILKLKPELLNFKDSNKITPLMEHAESNQQILKIMLDYEFDYTLTDLNGDTFLHHLCRNDFPDILKLSLKRCPELIDMPNKKSETPIIVSGQHGMENMFYVLKGMGATLNAKDSYGNTVYHYICSNSICLGSIVENYQNYFGLTPIDYCKISEKYYHFIK